VDTAQWSQLVSVSSWAPVAFQSLKEYKNTRISIRSELLGSVRVETKENYYETQLHTSPNFHKRIPFFQTKMYLLFLLLLFIECDKIGKRM
jgi:hypothetical protein